VKLAWRAGAGGATLTPSQALLSRHPAWTSAWIQWVGTVAFNVTTFWGLVEASGTEAVADQVIWRPDAVGSILFLVSSAIALSPDVRRHRHGHARDRSWAISALNMVGSIFFGISAVGAYVVPSSNELLNSMWANGGTFLGAICFLVGALLVLPRKTETALVSPEPA
jgi:divalent metal cation (Fe/Co/Zn/Cd) transporter